MANIVVFNNGRASLIRSANTPDYPTGIVNPDLSSLEGVPIKYWKEDNGSVVEMTQAEKNTVDAQELENRKNNADEYSINMKVALTALIKIINLRLPANQKITKQEVVAALREEIL